MSFDDTIPGYLVLDERRNLLGVERNSLSFYFDKNIFSFILYF